MLVCGGRDYRDRAFVFRALDRAHAKRPITLVIHGACKDKRTGELCGADRWAQEWAVDREIPYLGVPARWTSEGNAAGPKRNARMLEVYRPEGVTAFPGGAGTADMTSQAKAAGLQVWEPKP